MPRPVEASAGSYLPGLDGLRAVAVIAVVAYHLGAPWMPGGLLGVGVFFTLSGFLITSLLLESWERTGGLELRTFWLRRARRLLPGLLVVLGAVLAATTIVDGELLAQRRREALAAVLFVGNWHTIAEDVSYFDTTDGPGPLDHLWSLAVEEQFYLVWPLLLLALLRLRGARMDRVARLTLVMAGVSFALLAVLADVGFDNTRAYEGTDTRAGALLVGAALAMLWRPSTVPRLTRLGRVVLDLVGLLALAVVVWLMVTLSPYSMDMYHGGLLLLAVATAALVATLAHPVSWLARVMGVAPLRWVGERSYGIYLWHLPVVAFTPVALRAERPLAVAIVQLGLVGGLAALSWSRVENPIRRHGFAGFLGFSRPSQAASLALPRRKVAAGALVYVLVGTLSLAAAALVVTVRAQPGTAAALLLDGVTRGPSHDGRHAISASAAKASAPSRPDAASDDEDQPDTDAHHQGKPAADTRDNEPTQATDSTRGPRTACRTVVHVGDSTSLGLVDPAVLTAPQRLRARYRTVGVQSVDTDILGARSIVERYEDQPNAEQAVLARVRAGYHGCWVIAMGINEVANQQVGGVVPLAARIDLVMRHLDDQPVLWTTVRTLTTVGPYAQAAMGEWNQALSQACRRYPSMRVYDWAGDVEPAWYAADGIHYTSQGYAQRARRLATALARAFPDGAPPPSGCVVTTV